ncbi:uncharacterized protein Tco025E_06290 [Trypanosoma conorhini]|uniref:Uncharacterized protein n=1 Tax=Trypanosoma conorhini TaxID=83891 RepID=A0A422P681_9TRYP|nr:uncharacterized protein Tco025E_06290 [Trypanosoma conorhini]RNF13195.1 hypothetical protein Tco025E_06290 [Trypanosoma conorhini]
MQLRCRTPIISCHVNDAITVVSARRSCLSGCNVLPWRKNAMLSVLPHQRSLASVKGVRWASAETVSAAAVSPSSSRILLDGAGDFIDLGLDESETEHVVSAVSWEQQPALGVVRAPEIPEGQEYSRLNIPLAHPRAGRAEPRPNSRSIAAADDMPCVSNKLSKNEDESQDAIDLADMQSNFTEGGDGDAGTLPYDDELFAEMLLKMEVEGAIDEAWQDARKAHIEDVMELVEVLRSLKVREICAVDVSAKTGNFDYIVIGTCEGPRHIHLAAWAVQEADSLKRVSKIRRKQTDHTWEVVPVGRIIVNLMQEPIREEMALERKWAVTKCMDPLTVANAPVSEGRQVKAHGLWTLTLNLQDLEDFEVDYCKDVLMRQL